MFNHILIPIVPGHAAEYSRAAEVAGRLLAPGGVISALAVLEEIPAHVAVHIPEGIGETKFEDALKDLKSSLDDTVKKYVIEGHTSRSILDWANSKEVDCIVVSSHSPGFSDYFIGSTAARVVRHAQCAVVVLR